MTTDSKPEAIEISDEAYKQNTVYRPWSDIQAGIRTAKPYSSPAKLQSLKNPLRATPQ